MEPEFITYQKFNDVALANQLADLLTEHNINNFIEEQDLVFNPAFSYSDTKEYAVKVQPEDFERINDLLKQDASESIAEVEPDYYLLSFTNEELKDVVIKADEWSAFDVQLARKLLAERGHAVSDEEIEVIEEKRIEELRQPDKPQTSWIIVGYLAALLGGVFGIFIGWHLKSYKKTLPDGERVYEYSERDRWHGAIIFYLSIVLMILGILYRLKTEIPGL
jgi:hypothetical protein